MESLVGKLAHVCKVVSLGKTVLHRMFEPLSGAQQPCHHLWSNVAFWLDLMWWAPFLKAWNSVSLLQKFGSSQVAHHVLTDASGSFSFGTLLRTKWIPRGPPSWSWRSYCQLLC